MVPPADADPGRPSGAALLTVVVRRPTQMGVDLDDLVAAGLGFRRP